MNYSLIITIFIISALVIALVVVFYTRSVSTQYNPIQTTTTTRTTTSSQTTTTTTSISQVPLFNITPNSGGNPPLPPA